MDKHIIKAMGVFLLVVVALGLLVQVQCSRAVDKYYTEKKAECLEYGELKGVTTKYTKHNGCYKKSGDVWEKAR